ncbi:LamG-like jellyroll fold domain-containing protein [Hymenobacter lucidus]|uniref:Ig-like domain-containing protein n=1 Tax=Hymenobacter lucidus TaxID=2880930 RepID=A0ABS8APY4_9BACT|nr:LamG-like jellyroll fold domain-containing protein [Hymenobacter lucidus]MCB2406806.1 Ig-like domain-containing protein [Hymenobacter lucidus]
MKQKILSFLLILATFGARAQQQMPVAETFETDGENISYTSNSFSTTVNGLPEYFLRATVAQGSSYPSFRAVALGNQQGTGFWVTENTRGQAGFAYGRSSRYVLLREINAQNYKDIVVKVAFAAPRGAGFTGAASNAVRNTDKIRIQYSFDGGAFVTAGLLLGNNNSGGGVFQQDISSPLDSIPDATGVQLSDQFQDVTVNIPATGTTLRVRVVVDSRQPELAFDNIRVTGTLEVAAKPVLSNLGSTAVSYIERPGTPVQLTNSLLVTYSDNSATTLTGATVKIVNFQAQDFLNFINQNGISGSYNTGNGILTMSGTATQATYQAALRSITYSSTNTTTLNGVTRQVEFQAYNGTALSNNPSRNVAITLTLNAPAALNYTENFDADGEGTRYFGNGFQSASTTTGFFRATTNPAAGSVTTFTGVSGGFWYGEGTNTTPNPTTPTSTLQLAPVNAAGYSNLRFTIALGKASAWEATDYFKLYYRADGGSWVEFGSFVGGGTGGALTNGAGVSLSTTLQDVVFNLPAAAAAASLDFRLELRSDADEELAFDNIRVTGVQAPTLTTKTPTSVTGSSAVLGGDITADGGAALTERGVVYSTSNTTPTIGGTGVTQDINPATTSSFSETVAGLTAGTTYYVRAYATNSAGTGYGNVQTFTTPTTVVSIVRTDANPNNSASVRFTVTFATPVTGVSVNNFGLTFTGSFTTFGSVSSVSGSGTTYTVTVNTGAGDGTIKLSMLNATGISPGVSGLPFNGGETYDIDKTRPSVAISSSVGVSGSTTTTSPIPFTVTFSENVTGFVAGDVTVTNGSITGGVVNGTSPGTIYTFTVTPTTAGTATTVTVPANVAQDAASNFNTAAPASYSITYNQPNTTVASVTRLMPSPTATAQVRYQVVFANSVTGLTLNNFSVTSTTGASLSSASGSGTTYTVTVNTGTGNGTLTLNVVNGTGITPTVTNVPYTSGEQYTIVKNFGAAPLLTLRGTGSVSGSFGDVTAFVDQVQVVQNGTTTAVAGGVQNGSFEGNNVSAAAGSFLYGSPAGASPWTLGSQTGVSRNGTTNFSSTAADGTAVAFLQNGGANSSLTQNLAVPTGSYQVNFQARQRGNNGPSDQLLNVFLNDGINDVFIGAIQPGSANSYDSFTSAAFSVTAPALTATVSSPAAATGGTTNTTPIPFAVDFSQSVGTSFVDTDVTVTNGTITSGSFSGSFSSYSFTVTPTTFGTATTVSLAAGVAQDANNTLNAASNSYSVTYIQPTTPTPVVTIPSNGVTTNSTPTSLGSAVVGSTVRVYIDGVQVGTAVTPNSSGTWIRTFSGLPALTSGIHTVYATAQLPGQLVSAPSPTNTFTVQVPATYSSSSAAQASTARVVAGSTNQAILQVAIVIGGGPDAPISATSFTFTTTGSTTPADISAARVYYTGTSSTFAATNQFGSATANPNGTFTIGGTRQLVNGTNYFWLVYDVATGATNGNVLDATAPSFTLFDGSFPSTRNPSNPAPAGNRQIVRSTRVAGTALRFTGDATPGYVDFSTSTNPAPLLNTGTNGAYSQVAWIKPAIGTTSLTYYVLGNGTGNSAAPYIYVTGNGRLGAGFGNSTAAFSVQTSPNTVSADEWHYVAVTYTGATLTIYLDGENVGSVSASGTPAATRVNFIGNIAASATGNFPGDIDEVSQWNRALGQIELRRMRHLTLIGTELSLVSYMQFNDAGTTTLDVIANAVGTLTGATRVTSTAPVSSGTFNLQVVSANTTYTFSGTNVSMAFTGVTGSSETVVFRLDGKPLGSQPAATGLNTTYTPAYWIVDKYLGGAFTSANVTYTLSPTDISAADAATPSNLKLFKRDSNADGAFEAPISATAANAAAGTVTFPVTSFSQTVIGTFGTSPLPVELTEFTAERQGDDVLLRWATASETNNDRFEVESSIDGRVFKQIGRVAGRGTTANATSYQTTDLNVGRYAAGQVYYRLRQVDTDGSSTFSPVRKVQVIMAEGLQAQLYPNPSHPAEALTLQVRTGAAGPASWQLTDMLGRVVSQATNVELPAGVSTLPVSATELPTGVYLLKLQQGKHQVIRKLVRE